MCPPSEDVPVCLRLKQEPMSGGPRACSRGRWTPVASLTLVWFLGIQVCPTFAQTVLITKVIREELLPGYIIVKLATEPDFLKVLHESPVTVSTVTVESQATSDLHFSILSSENVNSEFFAIDTRSGVVSIQKRLDREKVCSFRSDCSLLLQVAASSDYGAFFQLLELLVQLTDINDNPPEFKLAQFELFIPENSETGRWFQLPSAFDRDTGPGNGVQQYRILDGPPLFSLRTTGNMDAADVYLVLQNKISRENPAVYKVLVGAVDGGLPSLTGTLTVDITIADVNDNVPVFEQSEYIRKIPEDTGRDQVIEQVKATDADTGPNGQLSYAFSAQQPPEEVGYFRLHPLTGEIFLAKSVESRAGQVIQVIVEASDQGHPPKMSTAKVKIYVEDTINSMPTILTDTLTGQHNRAQVSELAEVGKVVAYIRVQDPDSGQNGRTSCRLNQAELGLDKLDEQGKYKVVLTEKLDREVQDKYTVTISCWDHGFPSLLAKSEFQIEVLDENDQQPVFSQGTYEAVLSENNAIGAFITQVTASDADLGQNAVIKFEVAGTYRDLLSVDETGTVIAKVQLDREYSDKLMVTLVARDCGRPSLSASALLVVTLLDVNDVRPGFPVPVYSLWVEENQGPGQFVGMVSASDNDTGVNQDLEYRLVGQGADQFTIGALDGVIRTIMALDREHQKSYDFSVLAVDKGMPPLSGTAAVEVFIEDVNDNDPFFLYPVPGNNTVMVPHTCPAHRIILTVLAGDADVGHNAELVYSISAVNSSAPFGINPSTGAVFATRALTTQNAGNFTMLIMASDQGHVQQRSVQTLLFLEVFFDNSTLPSSVAVAAQSDHVIIASVIVCAAAIIAVIVVVTVVCIKRSRLRFKYSRSVHSSADVGQSTARLQGGFYIAPGIEESKSSLVGQDGVVRPRVMDRPNNAYVVFMPPELRGAQVAAEMVVISRSGYHQDNCDLDLSEDDQFSTFRSHQDTLLHGLNLHNLSSQTDADSVAKRAVRSDDSSEESTSDSGRGGSDFDVTSGAASKVRGTTTTPVFSRTRISHRLSPLLQRGKRFATFRGDETSGPKSVVHNDTLGFHQSRPSALSEHYSQDPTGSDSQLHSASTSPTSNHFVKSPCVDSIYFQPLRSLLASIMNNGSTVYPGDTQNPMTIEQLGDVEREVSELRQTQNLSESDRCARDQTNTSSIDKRRNQVPRLPLLPGIELTHPDFGLPNRNSLDAFSASGDWNHTGAESSSDLGGLGCYNYTNRFPRSLNRTPGAVNHQLRNVQQEANSLDKLDSSTGHQVSGFHLPAGTESEVLLPPCSIPGEEMQQARTSESTDLSTSETSPCIPK